DRRHSAPAPGFLPPLRGLEWETNRETAFPARSPRLTPWATFCRRSAARDRSSAGGPAGNRRGRFAVGGRRGDGRPETPDAPPGGRGVGAFDPLLARPGTRPRGL